MEAAARWHAQLEAGTADPAAFQAWRDADPTHAAAFARIAGIAHQFDQARAHIPPPIYPRRPRRRVVIVASLGIMFGAVLAAGVWLMIRPSEAQTAVGIARALTLPDGSRLALNTDTAVAWRFDTHRRRIWIRRGEIALTARPEARPLTVYGGTGQLQLAGGAVDARLRGGTLDLAVIAGNVLASGRPGQDTTKATAVAVGEGALIEPQNVHVRALSHDDLQFISGWQNGELVLNGQTLGAVVEEYNRYLKQRMVIADPSLDGIRLGGRFATHDPDRFLKALATGFGIHVSRDNSGAVTLSK